MTNFSLLLKQHFSSIRLRNPRYSMRAFAGMLGISPATLSKVMSGKQVFSEVTIRKVSEKLRIDPELTETFVKLDSFRSGSHFETGARSAKLSIELFEVFANWFHFAILERIRIGNGSFKIAALAKEFGLAKSVVENSIELLLKYGFIAARVNDAKSFEVKSVSRKIGDAAPSPAIREYHSQMISKAADSLHHDPIDKRNVSSLTLALSADSYEAAVSEIIKFRNKMARLADNDSKSDPSTR